MLGADLSVIPIGKVGDDEAGRELIREMQAIDLDLKYVTRCPAYPTLYSFCFIYPDGSGGNLTTADSACSQVDARTVEEADEEYHTVNFDERFDFDESLLSDLAKDVWHKAHERYTGCKIRTRNWGFMILRLDERGKDASEKDFYLAVDHKKYGLSESYHGTFENEQDLVDVFLRQFRLIRNDWIVKTAARAAKMREIVDCRASGYRHGFRTSSLTALIFASTLVFVLSLQIGLDVIHIIHSRRDGLLI